MWNGRCSVDDLRLFEVFILVPLKSVISAESEQNRQTVQVGGDGKTNVEHSRVRHTFSGAGLICIEAVVVVL